MSKINMNLKLEDSQELILNRNIKLKFNTLHIPFPLNNFIVGITL